MFRPLIFKRWCSAFNSSIIRRSSSPLLPSTIKSCRAFNSEITNLRVACIASEKYSPSPLALRTYHSSPCNEAYHDSHYWDYSTQYGPSHWENIWPSGTHQSPVDIETDKVVYDGKLGNFNIDSTPVKLACVNTGVQAAMSPNTGEKELALSGGPLVFDGYKFASFHFHWGEENTCGCEHTVDGLRYAAELHIVHFNTLMTKQTDLVRNEDIAVLGIFLDASEDFPDNPALDTVFRMLNNVPYSGQKFVSANAFSVYDLLPTNFGDYYTYSGSLTTPPLSENVIWTVFKEPIKISKRQQKDFTKLYSVEEDQKDSECIHDPCVRSADHIPQPPNICNNFRQVQPLHGRVVRSSFK